MRPMRCWSALRSWRPHLRPDNPDNRRPARRARLSAMTALTTLVMILGLACGGGDEGPSIVSGQVVTVLPASLTGLAGLELMDENGKLWQFEARGFVEFTPSHLEEHKAGRQAVKVDYFEENGRLVIRRITDE